MAIRGHAVNSFCRRVSSPNHEARITAVRINYLHGCLFIVSSPPSLAIRISSPRDALMTYFSVVLQKKYVKKTPRGINIVNGTL